jgi:hypothetical protein
MTIFLRSTSTYLTYFFKTKMYLFLCLRGQPELVLQRILQKCTYIYKFPCGNLPGKEEDNTKTTTHRKTTPQKKKHKATQEHTTTQDNIGQDKTTQHNTTQHNPTQPTRPKPTQPRPNQLNTTPHHKISTKSGARTSTKTTTGQATDEAPEMRRGYFSE